MTTAATEIQKREATLNRLVRPLGITAAAVFSGFAGFQTALVLGAPWGDHVWGGAFTGRLSGGMGLAGAAGAVVLLGMSTVVLARSGVIKRLSSRAARFFRSHALEGGLIRCGRF